MEMPPGLLFQIVSATSELSIDSSWSGSGTKKQTNADIIATEAMKKAVNQAANSPVHAAKMRAKLKYRELTIAVRRNRSRYLVKKSIMIRGIKLQ